MLYFRLLCANTGDYRGFYEGLKKVYGPTHQVQSPLHSLDGQRLNSNSNSNSIYFKSLKSQWFSGPYMSNTYTNTNIQAYTI